MPTPPSKIFSSLRAVIHNIFTKLKFVFNKKLKKQQQALSINHSVVKPVNNSLKKKVPAKINRVKSYLISDKEILYKKSQKIKYLDKLRKDKEFFKQQQYLKTVENNLKNANDLLIKQKKVFNKNLSLKEAQILTLSNKLKDTSLLKLNVKKAHNIKIQISQMLYFNKNYKKVDIFPTEDILLHMNVLKLLTIAIIKGIFELHNSTEYSKNFNKFSFILFYETFDGSSNSLSFPTSLIITDEDIEYVINFYEFPEKISFYNSILEFMLHLTEKYEGTSFHKISIFSTSIKWDQLRNAFMTTKVIK